MNELFLQDLPGYAPSGYKGVEAKLTLPAFEQKFRTWLLSDYHHRVHSETKCTPAERWEKSGFLPRMPDSFERLDLLLLTVAKTRRVQQDGFQGNRYIDTTLASYVKEDVLIRYDPADMAVITVFYEDRFLCRAICQELSGLTVSLKEIEKARSERRKQVKAGLSTRAAVVEQFIAIHQEETPCLRPVIHSPLKPGLDHDSRGILMSDQPEMKELLFASTKESRLFGEFCDACRKYRYIGLCHGVPGAGKTRSAREYASWDALSSLFPEELFTLVDRRHLDDQFPHKPFASPGSPTYADVLPCRTVYYTAPVAATASRIEREVMSLSASLSYLVEAASHASRGKDDILMAYRLPKRTELEIVDEADRLKMAGLEQLYVIYHLERSGRLLNNLHYVYSELVSDVLFQRSRARLYIIRDLYDRGNFGLVLIGQKGAEKRLARYPQLYSHVGFVHQFHVLSQDETRWLLEQRWNHLGTHIRVDDFTDQEALAAIVRITGGNFRVIHRLLMQVERILEMNKLHTVTKEVVEAARENLVLGQA